MHRTVAGSIGAPDMRLTIYVADGCPGCDRACWIAREVARRCAGVAVDVVDLSRPGAAADAAVFATPTYVLDGRVASLGNPNVERFVADLRARCGGGHDRDA